MEKEKEENIWRRSPQKMARILRSLGLETFANLRRDSVSDSVNFVSVLALKNLVSEKKYQYRRIWCRFWFWKIQSLWRKKVSVWVSVKILVSLFSVREPVRYDFTELVCDLPAKGGGGQWLPH